MKALQFSATGSLDHLCLVDLPTPVPGPDEVLIRVKAAGLNPSDVKNVEGRFPIPPCPACPAVISPGWLSKARHTCSAKRSGEPAGAQVSCVTAPMRNTSRFRQVAWP